MGKPIDKFIGQAAGTPSGPTPGGTFNKALVKIASDPAYRNQAAKNPRMLLDDFHLSLQDLEALHQAAVLSGADVSEVEKVRGAINASDLVGIDPTSVLHHKGQTPHGLQIEVSCCCCCCTGATAIA